MGGSNKFFDNLDFNVLHRVPLYKRNGRITYKFVRAAKIDINEDIEDVFSLEFIENLPENYRIQIGDTIYKKRPAEFVHDYLNQSPDYKKNLEPIVYDEIWIWREGS